MKTVMKNKKVIAMMVVGLVAIFLAVSGVVASPPMGAGDPPVESKINYQGQLTDDAGNPLDGTYDMEFLFYNSATGGSQVGSTITENDVAVTNGLFNVKLDVNQSDFNGQGLWLEVKVEGETLSPRQEILPVPYALSLVPGARIISDTQGVPLSIKHTLPWSTAVSIETGAWGSTGVNVLVPGNGNTGFLAYSTGESNHGVRAVISGNYSTGYYVDAEGNECRGVYAELFGDNSRGVYARTYGDNSEAVYGRAAGEGSPGVCGYSAKDVGVYGEHGTSGNSGGLGSELSGAYGEYGTNSNSGSLGTADYGAYGKHSNGNYGALGTNLDGVFGSSISGRGVEAYSISGTGVFGFSRDNRGVMGYSINGDAGYFSGDVRVLGDLTVTGAKSFVQPHPTDPSKQIVYVCLEGGENGVYVRGIGQLDHGRANIELPEHFSLVAAEEGLTAQVTPRNGKASGYLYVEEVSPDHIVVVEAAGGTSDARFDYLVMGVRKGFEQHEVIQENKYIKPDPDISQEEYEEWLALPKNEGMRRLLIENGILTPEGKINQETAQRLGWGLGLETNAERMEKVDPTGLEVEKS